MKDSLHGICEETHHYLDRFELNAEILPFFFMKLTGSPRAWAFTQRSTAFIIFLLGLLR